MPFFGHRGREVAPLGKFLGHGGGLPGWWVLGRFVGSRSAGSRGAFLGDSSGRSGGPRGVVARCSSLA